MHQMTCGHISNSTSSYLYNLFISHTTLNNSLGITDVHDLLGLISIFLFKLHSLTPMLPSHREFSLTIENSLSERTFQDTFKQEIIYSAAH